MSLEMETSVQNVCTSAEYPIRFQSSKSSVLFAVNQNLQAKPTLSVCSCKNNKSLFVDKETQTDSSCETVEKFTQTSLERLNSCIYTDTSYVKNENLDPLSRDYGFVATETNVHNISGSDTILHPNFPEKAIYHRSFQSSAVKTKYIGDSNELKDTLAQMTCSSSPEPNSHKRTPRKEVNVIEKSVSWFDDSNDMDEFYAKEPIKKRHKGLCCNESESSPSPDDCSNIKKASKTRNRKSKNLGENVQEERKDTEMEVELHCKKEISDDGNIGEMTEKGACSYDADGQKDADGTLYNVADEMLNYSADRTIDEAADRTLNIFAGALNDIAYGKIKTIATKTLNDVAEGKPVNTEVTRRGKSKNLKNRIDKKRKSQLNVDETHIENTIENSCIGEVYDNVLNFHLKMKDGSKQKSTEKKDSSKRSYLCPKCGFECPLKRTLDDHNYVVHNETGVMPEPRYFCKNCKKPYHYYCRLKWHRQTNICGHNTEISRFKCFRCSEKFVRRYDLEKHTKLVHKEQKTERNFKCQFCDKAFFKKAHLESHTSSVHLKKVHECSFEGCGKSFTKDWSLKVHMRIHTDEKPMTCEYCGYSCRQKNALNWHMKSKHTS